MINSHWEEQNMDKVITEFHESEMEKMGLPKWIRDISCPFCSKEIPLRSVRNVGLCLNTRNFGEIAVEVICDECNKMDTVYFRTNIGTMSEFISSIKSDAIKPDADHLLEEEMYKKNYNNIIRKMVQNRSEETL